MNLFNKLKQAFNGIFLKQTLIGGLEINDWQAKYILLDKRTGRIMKRESVKLSGGIVKNGAVSDERRFVEILRNLNQKISKKMPLKNVVVTISAANIYTQVFNLPNLRDDRLREAAQLNLQTLSPSPFNEVYADWQILNRQSDRLDILGAFVNRNLVDKLTELLVGAGFIPVVIEPASLSLARLINVIFENKGADMVFHLSGDGLGFMILRRGELYFNYFTNWDSIKGDRQKLTIDLVKNEIIAQIRRLLSFSFSKWGEKIENLIIVNAENNKEISEAIKGEKFELVIKFLSLGDLNLDSDWGVAVGAARRGLIDRQTDQLISLAAVGTEDRFWQSQLLAVTFFWRDAAISLLTVLVLVFGIFELLLINFGGDLKSDADPGFLNDQEEVVKLEKRAEEFNQLVSKFEAAKKESRLWSDLFRSVNLLAGRQVTINQFQFQQDGGILVLEGLSESEEMVIDFKNRLGQQVQFNQINLPLTAIQVNENGKAKFNLTLKVSRWP